MGFGFQFANVAVGSKSMWALYFHALAGEVGDAAAEVLLVVLRVDGTTVVVMYNKDTRTLREIAIVNSNGLPTILTKEPFLIRTHLPVHHLKHDLPMI